MASFQELAQKKVAGIPVLYLAGAFVAILAIVAWKMKPSTPDEEVTGDEATTPGNVPKDSGDPDGADYSGIVSPGTVTVVQGTQTADQEAVKQTNEDWERSAVDFLVESNLATPSEAQDAIRKYLDGAALSFDEGKLKDAAIRKLKLPPEPLQTIGTVGTTPAQRQAGALPGKHTVKGPNDNTATKLAQLYYGKSTSEYVLTIAAANSKLGTAASTYSPGTVVSIPAYIPPQYFKVTSSTRWPSQVAKKNGVTYAQVQALNPSKTAPYVVGSSVRIR
jgi:hypothetical protein